MTEALIVDVFDGREKLREKESRDRLFVAAEPAALFNELKGFLVLCHETGGVVEWLSLLHSVLQNGQAAPFQDSEYVRVF